jgi:hypothetical protein
MRLRAPKGTHLNAGEVIVFGIISGSSELVIKVRSLRRPVGGCSSLSCRCPHASFVRVPKAVLLELLYDDRPCRAAQEGLAERTERDDFRRRSCFLFVKHCEGE